MIALVTGGRNYNDANKVADKLFELRALHPDLIVVQGGATGADTLARDWCYQNKVGCATVPAPWSKYGLAAGPIRNGWMLLLKPDLVVAFPGGKGTANMVAQAKAMRVEVQEIL